MGYFIPKNPKREHQQAYQGNTLLWVHPIEPGKKPLLLSIESWLVDRGSL